MISCITAVQDLKMNFPGSISHAQIVPMSYSLLLLTYCLPMSILALLIISCVTPRNLPNCWFSLMQW